MDAYFTSALLTAPRLDMRGRIMYRGLKYMNTSLDQPASINSRFSSVDDHTRSLTTAGVRRSD